MTRQPGESSMSTGPLLRVRLRCRAAKRQKLGDFAQHALELLAVGNMAAQLNQHSLGRSQGEASDASGVLRRAVLVAITMNGEKRATNSPEVIVKPPVCVGGGEPSLDPGVQHPARLAAVVPFKALDLTWL